MRDLSLEYLKLHSKTNVEETCSTGQFVVLMYGDEGCVPKFYRCRKEEAKEILDLYKATGDVVIYEFDLKLGKSVRKNMSPNNVMLYEEVKRYKANRH